MANCNSIPCSPLPPQSMHIQHEVSETWQFYINTHHLLYHYPNPMLLILMWTISEKKKKKKEEQLDKKHCYRPHKQRFGISRYCCYKEANWKQFKFSPLYCHVKALEGIFSKAWNITALKTVGQSRLTAKQQYLPPHTKDWIIIFLLPLYLLLSFLSHRNPSQKQL